MRWREMRRSERVEDRRGQSPRRSRLAGGGARLGGGGLVYMLPLVGERISPESVAVAIGDLFSARGLGTGIRPIVARAAGRQAPTDDPAAKGRQAASLSALLPRSAVRKQRSVEACTAEPDAWRVGARRARS